MESKFFKKPKQLWVALIVISIVLCMFSWNVQSEEKLSKSRKEPILVFPVISDIHIKQSGTMDMQKFQEALEQLNEQAPKQDAFVVVGDLTDKGLKEEYDRFFSIYDVKKQPQAISLFTIGNHEYWNGLSEADAQKRFLAETGMDSIYDHKVIKGYHFIILGPENGLTKGYYSTKQINWLGEQLKQAAKDDPKKPIFVFQHQPIKNTVIGSNSTTELNRELLYNTLKEYPQVIHFSGHSHYPLYDPRTIYQKDFTAVGTSSVSYITIGIGFLLGELPPGYQYISQGLIVEVYKNKVVIRRRDFHKNDWTGEPWVIQLPVKANTLN
jgi:3',5'-cyclic AMP phosphodiesterase CpdA